MKTVVSVDWELDYQRHVRADFQESGHFLPGLKDEYGMRRGWVGNEVHVLTYSQNEVQVLRVLADSLPEAQRLMAEAIRAAFLGQWMADKQTDFNYAQWTTLNERVNQLRTFMASQYAWELEHGEHQRFADVFDAVVFYLRKERGRIIPRLQRFWRRQKPANAGEWVPPEWRA